MAFTPLSILLLLSTTFHIVAASDREDLSQELLHRDSPTSPNYNAFASAFDRLRAATHRSLSRAQSQSNKQHNYLSFTSMMLREGRNYFVYVSLGNPPYWGSLLVDTGSSLTWVHCEPSTGQQFQPDSLHYKFNPDTSSTYHAISSESPTCTQYHHLTAGAQMSTDDTCHYRIGYLDGSNSQGILFSDTLGTDGTTSYLIPNITFGCSHKTEEHIANIQGVVGLSPGPSSLVTQLGTTIGWKFSYCFASEPSSPSMLNFGNKAIVSGGVSTPLIVGRHHYYITLDDIVIDDGKGGADDHKITVRTWGSSRGNVLVDSGSPFTYLDVTIVQQLERKLSAAIKLPRMMPPAAAGYRLCFKTLPSEFLSFPDVLFRFAGRASLRLKPYNTFIVVEKGVVCLSILPRTYSTEFPSIFGSLAQQNFHIGYDLEAKKLSFAPTNCTQMAVEDLQHLAKMDEASKDFQQDTDTKHEDNKMDDATEEFQQNRDTQHDDNIYECTDVRYTSRGVVASVLRKLLGLLRLYGLSVSYVIACQCVFICFRRTDPPGGRAKPPKETCRLLKKMNQPKGMKYKVLFKLLL